MSTKIYFCFPYKDVGGVSILFMRMAHELAKKHNFDCILIDYYDGYMSLRARKDLVSVAHYSDDRKLSIADDSIIIFQSMTPWSIFPMLQIPDRTKVLFWNCHPQNLIPTLPGFRAYDKLTSPILRRLNELLLKPYKKQTKDFTSHLLDTNALVFMDKENLRSTEIGLGITVDAPIFIPIPSIAPKFKNSWENQVVKSTSKIRLSWIGRIVDFKYFILKRLLFDLEGISQNLNIDIQLTIIGNGSHHPMLVKDVAKLSKYKVRLIDHLEEGSLNSFLLNETDILFAMGTSALEGAKLGTPTVLLDYSYSEVPDGYQYRWLYQRDGSTLAERAQNCLSASTSLASLQFILKQWVQQKSDLSRLTLGYFNQNHHVGIVSDKLTKALDNSLCFWGDLRRKKLLRRGVMYPLFKLLRK